MGSYMETPEGEAAGEVFYDIAFGKEPFYRHEVWISGRVTTDDNFTFYEKPDLDENAPEVPAGDFIVTVERPMYYASIDRSRRLGWKENIVHYGDVEARVIEVLTGQASNAYKAFLRRLDIPYIIAGEDALDYALAMDKLYRLFDIRTLMLGGGGIVNWSFMQAGMCDEVSLVVAAAAGSAKKPALFSDTGGFTGGRAVSFRLLGVQQKAGGSLWLRYQPVYDKA